jgi:small-conductance mechanosensitive channel
LVLQGAFWANASIAYIIEHTMKKRKISGEGGTTTLTILGFLGRVVLWSFVLLTALNYLGINITALVTALGVGGIAIALAVQSLLGDIIGSLSIALDNPFEMGDVIQIDEYVGTVEKVGMKTTRVRSFTGELIIFSNSELLKSRIRNYKRMTERRALLKINVAYNTPHKKLAAIPDMIKEIVEKQLDTRFERAHLRTLGTYACEYEVVFSVLSPDMILYLNVVQEVNLEIIRRFERERIKFALPPYTSAI